MENYKLILEKDLVVGKTYFDQEDPEMAIPMVFKGVIRGTSLFDQGEHEVYVNGWDGVLVDFHYDPKRDWYEPE